MQSESRKPICDMTLLDVERELWEVSGRLWNSPRPQTPEADRAWDGLMTALNHRQLRAVLAFARQALDLAGEMN
jgi:hypothetical protein